MDPQTLQLLMRQQQMQQPLGGSEPSKSQYLAQALQQIGQQPQTPGSLPMNLGASAISQLGPGMMQGMGRPGIANNVNKSNTLGLAGLGLGQQL